MSVTGAVHWWEEWQLRVLVLCSLAIQCLLLLFSFMRRYAIPGWARFMMWLAYLAGDAVAIYALATLFNRHKTDEHGGSTLEVVWAPILLLHLGGHDGFTAYNIEDNELWSRHLLTAVSQVTVAIYVFCKSWPPGGDKRLLQSAVLLFVNGVLKCFVKPWALKSASIYSLVSSSAASLKQNEGETYLLKDYVKQAKDFVEKQNGQGEAQVDGEDNEVPGGMAIGTVIGEVMKEVMKDVRGALVEQVGRVKVKLLGAWVFVRGLLKADEAGAPSQGSLFGELKERMRDIVQRRILRDREMSRQQSSNNRVREMLQGRSEASKLFVDLSSSYSRRLSILEDFCGLTEKRAYGLVRQGLATAFLVLYTKLKTAVNFDNAELEGNEKWSLKYRLRMLIQLSRTILPWASIGLFHQSNRQAYNDIDVKITYAMFCCTAVLELYSSFCLALTGETGEEWPEMVAQYSFIGYFARNRKHSKKMWVVSLLGCKDFLDQHWCMKSCFSSARISKLVLRYLKDGWKEKIHDAISYRSFNDHRSSKGLTLSTNRNRPLLFDESVLLWHIATEFCFFSSSLSEHRCAFAKVPMWTKRLPAPSHFMQGNRRSPAPVSHSLRLIIDGIIERMREMVPKCICRTSLPVENGQTTSQCGQEFTRCKAVLCTQMSNYMAYLLFVNPEMLLPGSRRNLFTAAHQELQAIFKGDNQAPLAPDNKRELTEKIISKLNSSSEEGTTSGTFIHEAWMLAQKLQSSGDEKKMWEEIERVWVKMLCFSASRCRGYLHAKALGKGGEFLSYVWLLLFHMGMETFTDKLQREEKEDDAANHAATAPPSTSEQVSSATTGAGTAPSTSSDIHSATAGAGAAPSTSEIRMAEDDDMV